MVVTDVTDNSLLNRKKFPNLIKVFPDYPEYPDL